MPAMELFRAKRGVALISTLMLLSIFLMVLSALLVSAQQGAFNTDYHRKRELTRLVAEEALSTTLAHLREDPDWEGDVVEEPTIFGGGEYTVRFSESASVNNLTGESSKTGPYGPVAPGTALIRIEATTQAYHRTFDALVAIPNWGITPGDGVIATGRVTLRGDTSISGAEGYSGELPLEVSLVSNSTADESDLVTWLPSKIGDQISIDGLLETASPSLSSVNIAGFDVSKIQRLEAPKPYDSIDILDEIAQARDRGLSAPPSIVSGSPLPPGEFYIDDDLVLAGDLILDGTKLYVTGDVKLIGSLSGNGALVVGGATSLRGSSKLLPYAENSIALMSRSNVEINGFSGSLYMDTLTQGTGLSDVWTNTKYDMKMIFEEVSAPGYSFRLNSVADRRMRTLGNEAGEKYDSDGNHLGDDEHPDGGSASQHNKFKQLTEFVTAQPLSPTQQFMEEKLRYLRDYTDPAEPRTGGIFGFAYYDDSGATMGANSAADIFAQKVYDLQQGLTHDGLFDAANDLLAYLTDSNLGVDEDVKTQIISESGGVEAIRALLINGLRAVNMDQPGTSYFQGSIVTNGWLYAGHEITVVGQLKVIGDEKLVDEEGWKSSPQSPEELVGGSGNSMPTLEPGDLYIDGDSSVVYFADVTEESGLVGGALTVRQWFGH